MGVLTVADVKPYLGQMQTTNDADLEGFVAAAETAIEAKVGPLVQRSITKVLVGSGASALVMPTNAPIASVTSITGESGYVSTPYRIDSPAATIYGDSAFGESYYTVVFVAGWADTKANIPADLLQAVGWQVQHDWQSMRGKAQRGPDDLPRRIADKLSPYMLPGHS